MSSKGIFPALSVSEAVASLSGWGLSVSPEQISRPTQDFVEGLYCACLSQVTEIKHETLLEPVQAVVASVSEEKDLYTTALTHNLIVHHLTRFAQAARVDNFSAADISHPTKERTLELLSAFINFVKFTEERNDTYIVGLREGSDKLIADLAKAKDKYADLSRKVNSIKAKLAEDEPRCEELKKQNSQLRAQMFSTKEFQTSVVQQVEKLKAEKSTVIGKKEVLNSEINSVSDNIAHMRMRIVQSPERIKRTISTMSKTASEDKKMLSLTESKARDLKAKVEALHTIEQDLRGCIEQLQIIQKETQSLQESEKEVEELRDQFSQKNVEKNELILRKERVEMQLSNARDKLERAQRHAEDKRAASQRTIDHLQQQYDQMVVERRLNDQQVEELRNQVEEINGEMAEHLRKSEAELNELLAEYWKIRHATDLYMETLATKLNMRVSVVE